MGIFTSHARERAIERYGLDLHIGDMRQILNACVDGKALLGRSGEHGHVYLMRYNDRSIVPVLSHDKSVIMTFLPEDYFVAGANRKFHQRAGRCKQKASGAKFSSDGSYKRSRITVKEAMEQRDD